MKEELALRHSIQLENIGKKLKDIEKRLDKLEMS